MRIIGVKLDVRKVLLSHKFTRRDICVTRQLRHDALLETMPDINQALLQFIKVKNLLDSLLYFSHIL